MSTRDQVRIVPRAKQGRVRRINYTGNPLRDFYHFLMQSPWWTVLVLSALLYLLANTVFAGLYLLAGDGIANARPGSFLDAFFFSVQTMGTVGYGMMAPKGIFSNIIMTIEIFFGLFGLAMMTGIVFAKFSRPSAKVIFSRTAVVTIRDGVRSFIFRMANERSNQVAEAQIRLSLLKSETTVEGEEVRRFYDMKLVRDHTPIFALTWTLVHPIDEASPLWNQTRESLEEIEAEIIVSFTGHDATYMQTIQARHSYIPSEIEWDRKFCDILRADEKGEPIIDYGRIHITVPANSPACD